MLSKATLIGSWKEPRPQKPSSPFQSSPSTESLPEGPLQSPGRWALTSPQPTWAEGGCLTTETPVIRNPLPSPHFQWLLRSSSLYVSTQPWVPRFHSRCQSSALASWPQREGEREGRESMALGGARNIPPHPFP